MTDQLWSLEENLNELPCKLLVVYSWDAWSKYEYSGYARGNTNAYAGTSIPSQSAHFSDR